MRIAHTLLPVCVMVVLAIGCLDGSDDDANIPLPGGGATTDPSPGFLYVLQPDGVDRAAITASRFAWLVVEPSLDGSAAAEVDAAQVESWRTGGPCGGRTVLAYLSIGEAENYRDYWRDAWVDGPGGPAIDGVAPMWLGPNNPDWPGNYKVRYWDPLWQATILGTPAGPNPTPLDRIIDAGYDGVYLDIIDAYEFWSSSQGGRELTRAQARSRMIDWVAAIAHYARTTRGHADFLVFPQNAEDIILDDDGDLDDRTADWFAAISGVGIEDLFYDETAAKDTDEIEYRLTQLAQYRDQGKTVLVTDYVVRPNAPAASDTRAADFYQRATAEGFVPYAATADRELDQIVTLTRPDWSVDQPPAACDAP